MHAGSGTEYVCMVESQDIRTTKTSDMKLDTLSIGPCTLQEIPGRKIYVSKKNEEMSRNIKS